MSSVVHVSNENLREALELCERENDKARRIILWCAQQIPPDKRIELINMIKGSIVIDSGEEDREYLLKFVKAVEKLTAVVDEGVNSDGMEPPTGWWAKVDAHANQVRGLAQELDLPPTLHEVRNGLLP